MLNTSTLRPGLLVSLKTQVVGNVRYNRQDIEADHLAEDGTRKARWETERTVIDPTEHEAALKVQAKISSLVRGVCAKSAFGLLCPERAAGDLDVAVSKARELADQFNATAVLTRVHVYVIAGRIADNDAEAMRAINSEVRDLLGEMEEGVKGLDVERIRGAANRAKQLGSMLSEDAAKRMQAAIDAVRSTARGIVKAADGAACEIDVFALRKITEGRTAFLEFDETAEIKAPEAQGTAIEFEPTAPATKQAGSVPAFALEM